MDVVMLAEIQIVYVIDYLGFDTSDELADCVYMWRELNRIPNLWETKN